MPVKTQEEMVRELYQVIIGIPNNPDENGLIGDVKEIKENGKTLNGRLGKAEGKINKMWGILIGIGAVGGTGLGMGIKSLLGS